MFRLLAKCGNVNATLTGIYTRLARDKFGQAAPSAAEFIRDSWGPHQKEENNMNKKTTTTTKKAPKVRAIMEVVTDVKHPETGKPILNQEQIEKALKEHASSIRAYAYGLHESDDYKEEDLKKHIAILQERYKKNNEGKPWEIYLKEHQRVKVGEFKPAHWHIPLRLYDAWSPDDIGKWFGVSGQYVQIVRGKRGVSDEVNFYDKVRYLTHEAPEEQAKGKHLYPDEIVHASFNFREFITKMEIKLKKYGRGGTEVDILEKVMRGEISLNDVRNDFPEIYVKRLSQLKQLRNDYIKTLPVPPLRMNFYIEGNGGIGKGVASKAIARCLYPELTEEELYFEVGGKNVSFDGYDGQPVIIWNDVRSGALIHQFGRGEVFDIFDIHPTSQAHNVKYDSVKLVNTINIVNGIEPYRTFLDGLSGEYTDKYGTLNKSEDKSQSYRRFPMIFCLRDEDLDILLNKGVVEDSREFESYIMFKNMRGSFARMALQLEGQARAVVEEKLTAPIKDAVKMIQDKQKQKITSEDEIPDEFKDYGEECGEDIFMRIPNCIV